MPVLPVQVHTSFIAASHIYTLGSGGAEKIFVLQSFFGI